MHSRRSLSTLFGLCTVGMVSLATLAGTHFPSPFPPLATSLSSPVARLSDFTGIAMGFRKLTADLAWVQTLLYYGTEEAGTDDARGEETGTHYLQFLSYCERVAQIDPAFKHVYYYGAGALGWNLNRLDEADKLLREGIEANPREYRFHQFLAALAFQKDHDVSRVTEFLESYSHEPDCPNLLRSVLANIYKKQHRLKDAVRIWALVYDTHDPAYEVRALSQLQELLPQIRQKAQKLGPSAH